jgi:hypothetical protein
VSAAVEHDGSARPVRRRWLAFGLADFTRSIMLMEAIGRVEADLAKTLRAMAALDGGEAAARRLRLAEDAAKGAQVAAEKSEHLRRQARHWAERAGRVQVHQALDRAMTVLVEAHRAETDLAGTIEDLARYGDPDVAVRWRRTAAEASAAARQARDRAQVLRELARTDGSGAQTEGTPAADSADDPAPPVASRHLRLGEIDRSLSELRQTRSGPAGGDTAQAMAQASRRAGQADRLLQASVAHSRQTRQLAENALRRAATAHDRAADANERSARTGIGDVAEHNRMAAVHRAAAEADRRQARELQSHVTELQLASQRRVRSASSRLGP